MSAVTKMDEIWAPTGAALTPMDMLNRAVASGATIEVLEKLMGLQERWEKNQARKDFDNAVAEVKAKMPPILKNREGHNGKRYADFAAIAKVIDPIIAAHGLSYRFRSAQDDKTIQVACVLSHRSGHFEENTLAGPADTSGSKNAIQAIGSTLSYLQRYSLIQALGLAVSQDDDGAGMTGEVISEAQISQLNMLVVDAGADIEKFCNYMKVPSLADIPAKNFQRAVDALRAKIRAAQ